MVGLGAESSRTEQRVVVVSLPCSQNCMEWFKYVLGPVRSGTVSPCCVTRFTCITTTLLWCKSGVKLEAKKPFITVQRELLYCHGP